MAGYLGSRPVVVQVDGYQREESESRYVNVSGDDFSGHLDFVDDAKARFGSSDELHIYTESSGSGHSYIQGDNIVIRSAAGTARLTVTSNDVDVSSGALKVGGTTVIDSSRAITATGMAVTGTVKLDGNYPTGSRNVAMGDDALGTISSGASNVALGHNASKTASSAQQTTAVGDQALYDNTASYNTAVGYRAAFNVSSGVNNTAIGTNSLYSSSTTNGNVAVGESSVYGNTGGFNIGVGNSTLRGAGAGEKNIAIGDSALRDNTSGSNQVAIGYQSLTDNLTGTRNTAVGHITLSLSQTTNDNTVMGYLAGRYTVGGSNTALGAYAMSAGSGSGNSAASNVAVGKEALEAVTTGSYNVALGAEAGERVTTATEGVYIGFQAANYTQGGIDNTAVGTQSLYDNVSGEKNVAVGKASLGDLGTGGASAGNRNTAVGSYAFRLLQDANDNTAVGYQAGYTTTAGARLALFGYKAGFSGTNSSFQDNAMFGFEAGESNDGNNNAFFGSRAGEATTSASSNTYIGTEAGQNSGSANGNTFIGRGSGKQITGQNNTVIGRYTGDEGGLDIRTSSNNIVMSDGDGNPQFYIKGDTGATKFVGDGRSDSGAPYGGVVSMAGRTSNIGGAIASTQVWHKIYHRSFLSSNSFGHSIIRIEVLSNGETDGSYSYGTIIISTKQQSANDYYRVHLKSGCTNMFNRVAYKFNSTGGTQGAGSLEVYFKPKSYCHTELFVNINRDYMQDVNNGYVEWNSTGSTSQPASTTLITSAGSDS